MNKKKITVEYGDAAEYRDRLSAALCILEIAEKLEKAHATVDKYRRIISQFASPLLRPLSQSIRQKIRNKIAAWSMNRHKNMDGGYGYLYQASAVFTAFALNGFLNYCASKPVSGMPELPNAPRDRLVALYRAHNPNAVIDWQSEPFCLFDDCFSEGRSQKNSMRDRIGHPLHEHEEGHLKKTFVVDADVDTISYLDKQPRFGWEKYLKDGALTRRLYTAVFDFVIQVSKGAKLPHQTHYWSASANLITEDDK